MLRKNALLITDSLGLPRIKPEKLTGNYCWTHRIANENNDYDVYLFSRSGFTSRELLKNVDIYFKSYEPDVIIIQLGIVDCAPRALSFNELKLISSIPVIRTLIKKLIDSCRKEIVKRRKITYVTENEFVSNLSTFKAKFPTSKIFAIKIAPPTSDYEKISPGITVNINRFNKLLEKTFITIDPYESVNASEILMSDHHHLNGKGQSLVFKKVKALIFNENV